MKKKEIEKVLEDATKYGIFEKSEGKYRYNKKNLTKLAEGITTKNKYDAWIEILWKSGYFGIARTTKEIKNMIEILTLK